MQTIAVLYTTINGRRNYVADHMQSHSTNRNKKIVHYTTEPEKAKDFGSIEDAEAFIPSIVNPHERMFTAGLAEVDPAKITDHQEASGADLT